MMKVNKGDAKHHFAAFKYILSTRLRKATTLLKSLQQLKKKKSIRVFVGPFKKQLNAVPYNFF